MCVECWFVVIYNDVRCYLLRHNWNVDTGEPLICAIDLEIEMRHDIYQYHHQSSLSSLRHVLSMLVVIVKRDLPCVLYINVNYSCIVCVEGPNTIELGYVCK
jgi:hypothetical protein